MSNDQENRIHLSLTGKVTRDFILEAYSKGIDVQQAAVRHFAGPDLRFYPIGDNGDYVVLNTLNACILAYERRQNVQDIVDEMTPEFLKHDNPGEYAEKVLYRIIENIDGWNGVSDAEKKAFADKAYDYAIEHTPAIQTKNTQLDLHLLWEMPDGQFVESIDMPEGCIA